MSNNQHSDKAEFAKVKQMKDKYEAQIKVLTQENETLKKENKEYPPKISELEAMSKDWQTKHDVKVKEIEKLLADLKK